MKQSQDIEELHIKNKIRNLRKITFLSNVTRKCYLHLTTLKFQSYATRDF